MRLTVPEPPTVKVPLDAPLLLPKLEKPPIESFDPSVILKDPDVTLRFPVVFVAPRITGLPFKFDRLGVRVPAILVSPWIPKNTVVTDRIFDHASIPATVSKFFLGDYPSRPLREINADVFIEPRSQAVDPSRNLLSLATMRDDCPEFQPADQ